MALLVDNLVVGPSPAWMVQRLEAAGMRPINNIVDMTNYVMHEFGQPMHAFDRDQLDGRPRHRARGRAGRAPRDAGSHRAPADPAMTVIADLEKPVGLAGIMGGFDAEVSDATTQLLLEVAHFDPTVTRATSRALKLRTDASARYERGLDPEGLPTAVARAAQLITELCPARSFVGLADAYPVPVEQRTISFPFERIERLLGMRIDERQVLDILGRLEFEAEISGGRSDGDSADLPARRARPRGHHRGGRADRRVRSAPDDTAVGRDRSTSTVTRCTGCARRLDRSS